MERNPNPAKSKETPDITAGSMQPTPRDYEETSYKLACSSCGAVIQTSNPLADGATYSCALCNSSIEGHEPTLRRARTTRANSEAFKARLEPFRRLSFEGHEPEWFELAMRVGIDPVNIEEFVEAVRAGRWHESNAPKQHLRRRVQEAVERNGSGMDDPFVYEGIVYIEGKRYRHGWKRRYDGKTVCFSERNADGNFSVDLVADSEVHESQHTTAKKGEAAKGKVVSQFQELTATHIAEVEMGLLDEALDLVGADAFEQRVIRASIPTMTFTTSQGLLANTTTRFPATVIIPVVTQEGEEGLLELFVRSREEFLEKSSRFRFGAPGFPCCLCEPNLTRQELLASAATDTERRALQAACKRLQRKNTMSALRRELRSRALRAAIERADRRGSWESDFEPEDHGKHTKARWVDRDDFAGTLRRVTRNAAETALGLTDLIDEPGEEGYAGRRKKKVPRKCPQTPSNLR